MDTWYVMLDRYQTVRYESIFLISALCLVDVVAYLWLCGVIDTAAAPKGTLYEVVRGGSGCPCRTMYRNQKYTPAGV